MTWPRLIGSALIAMAALAAWAFHDLAKTLERAARLVENGNAA